MRLPFRGPTGLLSGPDSPLGHRRRALRPYPRRNGGGDGSSQGDQQAEKSVEDDVDGDRRGARDPPRHERTGPVGEWQAVTNEEMRRIVRQMRLRRFARPSAQRKWTVERLTALGRCYGVSSERVRQLIAKDARHRAQMARRLVSMRRARATWQEDRDNLEEYLANPAQGTYPEPAPHRAGHWP